MVSWPASFYYEIKDGKVYNQDGHPVISYSHQAICENVWEFYHDPEPDWQYIIDHKCLCWFWDDDYTDGVMAILVSVYKDSSYRYYCRDLAGCGSSRKNCRPVRRDEVTFYGDKKDE